jgi:PIN domain nuclease of toxin-antitoxin system
VVSEPKSYVLDSYALLAYLQDEPGAARVQRLLNLAKKRRAALWISVVNLAEALYITERERCLPKVQQAIAVIDELPLNVVEVDRALAFSAAHVKARHALAFADAFAVALAKEKKAFVVTGDPEFKTVAKEIPIEWLA